MDNLPDTDCGKFTKALIDLVSVRDGEKQILTDEGLQMMRDVMEIVRPQFMKKWQDDVR